MNRFRDPISGISHLIAAIAAAFGTVTLLILSRGQLQRQIALLIYGISLILLFSASATYHMVIAKPGIIQKLRKFDHSAIYLLIAGTYTPICLQFFTGFWRWGMLGIIWAVALIGIIVKIFIIDAPRWVVSGAYLVMGWFSILAIPQMLKFMPTGAIIWLVVGGLFYSVGAFIYTTKKMDFKPGVFGFHEVWHIFVIFGALSHFIVTAVYIAPV
jgi:hemolysin III